MIRINLLAIVMIVLGTGPVHFAVSMMGGATRPQLLIACGLALITVDALWRARNGGLTPKERWFEGTNGGVISIFPVWGIGIAGCIFGLVERAGYTV